MEANFIKRNRNEFGLSIYQLQLLELVRWQPKGTNEYFAEIMGSSSNAISTVLNTLRRKKFLKMKHEGRRRTLMAVIVNLGGHDPYIHQVAVKEMKKAAVRAA